MASDTPATYTLRPEELELEASISGTSSRTDIAMPRASTNAAKEDDWPWTDQVSVLRYSAARATPTAHRIVVRPADTSTQTEVVRLMEQVAELEREIEAIQTAFANQELRILNGYIISVRPGIGVPFAARCPKLRAVAQGDTIEGALADLEEAMSLFLAYRRESGKPIPPKDVEA